MPNHVKNLIVFRGDNQKQIDEVLNFVSSKDKEGEAYFDFNKLIPMPEILNETQSGTQADRGALLLTFLNYGSIRAKRDGSGEARFSITNPDRITINENRSLKFAKEYERIRQALIREQNMFPDSIPINPKELIRLYFKYNPEDERLGKLQLEAIKKTGLKSWYEWSINNWGTKWNSYDNEFNYGENAISFSTAWSFPEPVMNKLIEKFPEVEFSWMWADEDRGHNTGQYEYFDGVLRCGHFDDGSNEAYDLYVDLWGEDESGNDNTETMQVNYHAPKGTWLPETDRKSSPD